MDDIGDMDNNLLQVGNNLSYFTLSFLLIPPLFPGKDIPLPSPASTLTADEFPSPISMLSPSIVEDHTSSLEELLATPTTLLCRTPIPCLFLSFFISGSTPVLSTNTSWSISSLSTETVPYLLPPFSSSEVKSPLQYIPPEKLFTPHSFTPPLTTSEVSTVVSTLIDPPTLLSLAASTPPPHFSTQAAKATRPASHVLPCPPSLLDIQVNPTQELIDRLFSQKTEDKKILTQATP